MSILSVANAVGGMMLALGTPGMAGKAAASPALAPPSSNGPARARPDTKYCVLFDATGTRIPRRVCQTRDAWMKDGFDPLAPRR
jgi:hypothetical protein